MSERGWNAREAPNRWQEDHRDAVVPAEVYQAAQALIDRKLTGPKRTEAKTFVYRSRRLSRVTALMAKLESLPDLEEKP